MKEYNAPDPDGWYEDGEVVRFVVTVRKREGHPLNSSDPLYDGRLTDVGLVRKAIIEVDQRAGIDLKVSGGYGLPRTSGFQLDPALVAATKRYPHAETRALHRDGKVSLTYHIHSAIGIPAGLLVDAIERADATIGDDRYRIVVDGPDDDRADDLEALLHANLRTPDCRFTPPGITGAVPPRLR